ncbi:MAG: hypothetical protein ACRC8S_01410 [Fimbriiglobus sp.]
MILRSLMAFVFLASVAYAQEPMPVTPLNTAVYSPQDGLFAPRETPAVEIKAAEPEPSLFFDVLLGLPIAFRAQHQIGGTRGWIEGGVALYVIVPSVFAGVRFDGIHHCHQKDGFYVRPGIDVYYSPIRGDGFLFGHIRGMAAVVADVDITWCRQWSDRMGGHIGMKIGCGIGADLGGDSNLFPVPILALTMGLHF